jgi:hypothetical protein
MPSNNEDLSQARRNENLGPPPGMRKDDSSGDFPNGSTKRIVMRLPSPKGSGTYTLETRR